MSLQNLPFGHNPESVDKLIEMLQEHKRLSTDLIGKHGTSPSDSKRSIEVKTQWNRLLPHSRIVTDDLVSRCYDLIHDARGMLTESEIFLVYDRVLRDLGDAWAGKPKLLMKGTRYDLVAGEKWWKRWWRTHTSREIVEFKGGVPVAHLSVVPKLRSDETIGHSLWGLAFRGKETLRLGFCPLDGGLKPVFGWTAPNHDKEVKMNGFAAKSQADGLAGHLKEAMDWAAKERVDVLCFPELAIGEDGREYLKGLVGKEPNPPMLIMAGSFHEEIGGQCYNQTPVWLSVNGALSDYHYRKFERLYLRTPDEATLRSWGLGKPQPDFGWMIEDITADNGVLLFESPIGWIGVVICRDFLVPDNRMMQTYLACADHLFVLSLNFEKRAGFKSLSEDHRRNEMMAIYYVNAGNAQPKPPGAQDSDFLAFAVTPISSSMPQGTFHAPQGHFLFEIPLGIGGMFEQLLSIV